MSFKVLPAVCCAAILGLAACAQQEETVVYVEPVFDKFGNSAPCDDGTQIPGTTDLPPCEPEDCTDDTSAIAAGATPCPPRFEGGDDPSGRGGSSPTGGARP